MNLLNIPSKTPSSSIRSSTLDVYPEHKQHGNLPYAAHKKTLGIGGKKGSQQLGHYVYIGETLSRLEASFWLVGIPWAPKHSTIKTIPLESTLLDTVKVHLVNIPTSSLELYCEDLEELPPSSESAHQLALVEYTTLNRMAFPASLALVTSIGNSLLGYVLIGTGITTLSVATLLGATAIGATLTSEGYRRASFFSIIQTEIQRRRGLDKGSFPLSTIKLV